jgi:DNA-binding NarL/FixJ family response regulator
MIHVMMEAHQFSQRNTSPLMTTPTPTPPQIKILVVNDHDLLRESLITSLDIQDDLCVAGTAANREEAIARCEESMPNVALIDLSDINEEEHESLSVISLIHETQPEIQLIAFANIIDESNTAEARVAGAAALVQRGISAEELAQEIRAASKNHQTRSPKT